ncbi:MAG: ATP-dependent sacrificial sulfur transferase LarE [Planctomycetaceae bacterium]|nr:ATP-dependent sacrificial sulfur transferase LarE [Planctomycetaceae bacterium]
MDTTQTKQDALRHHLRNLGNIAVAFSSGVDSTYLLKTAHDLLGNQTLAVTVHSRLSPQRELDEAVLFTRNEGIEHVVLEIDELTIPGFAQNPADRCYLCKTELFTRIRRIAEERGIVHVAEGSNADDSNDYRPGMRAIAELGILSPLRDAGLTKAEIRQLSHELGLPTWNKQSFACLASRIPYGEEITKERLAMIDMAEQYLLDAGFHQVRVRLHGNLARIEADEEGLQLLADKALRESIHCRFKEIGFTYVAVDLLGYRTGSMNETL